MDAHDKLQQHISDLRERTIRAINEGYCSRELGETATGIATSIRGLREFRGNRTRLDVLVAAFTARLEKWTRLVEVAEAEKRKKEQK